MKSQLNGLLFLDIHQCLGSHKSYDYIMKQELCPLHMTSEVDTSCRALLKPPGRPVHPNSLSLKGKHGLPAGSVTNVPTMQGPYTSSTFGLLPASNII